MQAGAAAKPDRRSLIEEAAKKAAVAWVAVPGAADRLVWTVWLDDAFYLVTGPGEQLVPGLAEAATARVTLRGDHGGAIVSFTAEVSTVDPGADAVEKLAAKRLNAPGSASELVERWARSNLVSRLVPVS